ncbi:MAG: S8 family serine peptidase [Bdellovibrionaceae bacterium]|jgi:thermitase|nr:S8 family serine peptidase [Pseudobdellovibrionaceae bacterium]
MVKSILIALFFLSTHFVLAEQLAEPGEYVVQLKKPFLSIPSLEVILNSEIKTTVSEDIVVIKRSILETQDFVLSSLKENKYVKIAEPNFIYTIDQKPNDFDFDKSWGMKNFGQKDSKDNFGVKGVDISAIKAWQINTNAKNVLVAIIDTGIDYNHPDLKENMWTNTLELNGKPGLDDDGNGYVDDIYGYDFFSDKSDPMDDHDHGTHCAGVIGAVANNSTGVAGIAWNVKLMALKFIGSHGGGNLESAVKAIKYASLMGAHISNNSWGGSGRSQILLETIKEANAAGTLFVAAAGNSGRNADEKPSFPAAYEVPNIISVAAVDNRGGLANFSNYGVHSVDIGAPGVNVYSTITGGYEAMSGTSMASPHVAGVAALLLGHESKLNTIELKKRILDSAAPLAALRGFVKSEGMVNAYYALTGTKAPIDPNDPLHWDKHSYSISTSHDYSKNFDKTYKVYVEGAKNLSVHFKKFEIEALYDRVFFFDGKGKRLAVWSGEQHDRYSPIANGDTLIIRFVSDETFEAYGFDVDLVSYRK